jgi:hypothetical protein
MRGCSRALRAADRMLPYFAWRRVGGAYFFPQDTETAGAAGDQWRKRRSRGRPRRRLEPSGRRTEPFALGVHQDASYRVRLRAKRPPARCRSSSGVPALGSVSAGRTSGVFLLGQFWVKRPPTRSDSSAHQGKRRQCGGAISSAAPAVSVVPVYRARRDRMIRLTWPAPLDVACWAFCDSLRQRWLQRSRDAIGEDLKLLHGQEHPMGATGHPTYWESSCIFTSGYIVGSFGGSTWA